MTHDRFFSSLNHHARAPLALAMAALMAVTPLAIPGVAAQSADDPGAMTAAQDNNSQGQDGTTSLADKRSSASRKPGPGQRNPGRPG